MGPPGGDQKPSKRGGDGGGGSGGDHRLHHQHRGEEDDGSSSVRNLVRTIREELLVLHREQQQQQQQKGGANASDENNSERRTKSVLEKLVETHFRGGVFGGTSSSSFFLCSSMHCFSLSLFLSCFQKYSLSPHRKPLSFSLGPETSSASAMTSSSSRVHDESLTVEVLRVLRDAIQKRPNLFKRGDTFSSAAAATVFLRVFPLTCAVSSSLDTRRVALELASKLMQFIAVDDREGWIALCLGASRAVEDAREGLILQQERLTATEASSSYYNNNNNTNVAEYVASSFAAIVEHFEMKIIDADFEGKENSSDVTVKKKKSAEALRNEEFLSGLKRSACISLDLSKGVSAMHLFVNAALQVVSYTFKVSPQIASTMITPQTIDAIVDLSAYAGSYEVRSNALKCAKSISVEFYENIGREDFAIAVTLNVLHYFDPNDEHTSNLDVVRMCLQTLQQQQSSNTSSVVDQKPSSHTIVDNVARLVEALTKCITICQSREVREILLEALLLVATCADKEEKRVSSLRRRRSENKKRRNHQQQQVSSSASDTIGVLCSRACASIMHCAVTRDGSMPFSGILAIAMRAPHQSGKIGRNNNVGRKQSGKEFSDEDTDFEDQAFFREETAGNIANLDVIDEEKQRQIAAAKWTESCVISMLEQLGLPRKNTDPDSPGVWIPDARVQAETTSFNSGANDIKTLERIGAIVTLAKSAAMSDSADEARACSEKFISTWLQWFGKNKNPRDKSSSAAVVSNRDSVDIETVALAREKFCAFTMLCDAATALLLAATTKKRRNDDEDKSNQNMDVSTTRGSLINDDDFSLLNVHDITPDVVLWPYTRYVKDPHVSWVLLNASKFTDNSKERRHARALLDSTTKSKIASVALAITFIATTEKSSGTIVSAELAKRVLQRAVVDEDERVKSTVVMALPFAKFFAERFSPSSQALGELTKKAIDMTREEANKGVPDAAERYEILAAKAIAAMAIGVNYDLGCLAVALSLSDTLIEKSNENNNSNSRTAYKSYEVDLERLRNSLTSKAISAVRLASEKKYEDLECICESIHSVVNINLVSASETRRKILNALFARVSQQDRGSTESRENHYFQNNVFRIASSDMVDHQPSKSKTPSRGRTSRAKAMSELEVQKMPFLRDELEKLCIEEYSEIFSNFLVCDDCPEINEAEDGTEEAKKQRMAAWRNNNVDKKWEADAIKVAVSSLRRVLETSLTCGPDFLDRRRRKEKETFALFGTNKLIGYAWRLAHHESPCVRKAVLDATRIFSRREILLEDALVNGEIDLSTFSFRAIKMMPENLNSLNLRRQSSLNVALLWGGAPSAMNQNPIHKIEIEASLKLLRHLKIVVDEAPTDTARELSLRVFSTAAMTVPARRDALTIEAMFCVKHIVPNSGESLLTASTAALLLHTLAKKRDIRPKELLLGDAQIAEGIGCIIPNNKEMLRTLCEAVVECSERELLDALLPAAFPTLVRKRDIKTLGAYAKELRGEKSVKSIVTEFAYVVIADFLSARDNEALKKNAIEFLEEQTGLEIETLIADNALYLIRCLIKSAGANEKVPEPVVCAKELKTMLHDIGRLALGDEQFTTLPDFLRAHFTAVEMLMYEPDEKRNEVIHRRFLKSLAIMVILIQDHLPQFAPKVMAHFSAALERKSLRKDALRAWLIFVQVIAKHSNEYLSRIAGQIVVTMLPYLQNSDQENQNSTEFDEGNGDASKKISSTANSATTDANLAAAVLDELVLKAILPKPILASLPLLPRLERLRDSNTKLDDARRSNLLEDSLGIRLQALTNSLSQTESAAVRETALVEIYRALSNHENTDELNALVKGSSEGATADSVVGNLGFALLKSFSHDYSSTGSAKNEQARVRSQRMAAKCLGELGAIDPGRLGITTESVDLHLDTRPTEVSQTLLVDHLARMVRGATDAIMLDATAFCAQKVLITSECRPAEIEEAATFLYNQRNNYAMDTTILPEGSTKDGAKFWSELPEEARTTLAPYLTTIYTSSSNKQLPSTRPIYGTSSSVNSFSKWIQQWCRVLAIEARGPCADLFENCLGVFRHDTRLTLYLLPHMVLDALTGQTKEEYANTNEDTPIVIDNDDGDETARMRRLSIELEILAVLRDAAGIVVSENEQHVVNTSRGEISPNDVVAFSALRSQRGRDNALNSKSSASGGSGGIAELAAQAIFHLLDQLETWVANVRISSTRRHSYGANAMHKNAHFVQEFLENIPKTLLAKAAQNCGASVRALRYFEDHCRAQGAVSNPASANFAKTKLDMADGDVSFLASVYQGLAEPDQLLALPRFRAQPKVEDELLRHEEAGEWEEALIHYESELSKKTPKSSSSSDTLSPAEWGRLRCLKGLGHLRTVQRDSETLLAARRFSRNRKETAALAESGANAAWRLGRWDDLESLLTKLDNENARRGGGMHSYDGTVTTTASLEHVIGSSRKRIRSTAGGGILSSRLHRHQAVNVFNDDDDVSGLLTNLSSSAFNPKAPADGDAAIGRIMLALTRNNNRNGVNNCDEVGFRRAMKSARDAVLAPLAAAAMEGSWQRAHPSLVRLHLLQECAAGFEAVKSFREETGRMQVELARHNEIPASSKGNTNNNASRSRLADTRTTANRFRISRESKSGIPVVTQTVLNAWDARLERVPATIQTREPILALRRCIYGLLHAAPAQANAWLAQARACRTAGHHGAAQLALLEARNSMQQVESGASERTTIGNNVRLALEQAKLLWAEGKQHKAVSEIQEVLGFTDENNNSSRSGGSTTTITEDILAEGDEDAKILAKATLKLARWAAVTGQKQKNEILELYKRAKTHYGSREKAHFHLARYLDELLKDAQRREAVLAMSGIGSVSAAQNLNTSSRSRRVNNQGGGRAGSNALANSREVTSSYDLITEAAKAYGASAKNGHRHVYASIPRMLTLWFDAGDNYERMHATYTSTTSATTQHQMQKELQRAKKCCEDITLIVKTYSNAFPLYKWLVALPQLTSRLTHKNEDVLHVVQTLVSRLFRAYSDQTLWQLAPMLRSRDDYRKRSALQVLQKAIREESSHREQIAAFQAMGDHLVKLCAFQPKAPTEPRQRQAKSFSLEKEFPGLCAMLPSQIMIPIQLSLTAALPPKDSNPTDHTPFPAATPSFYGFVDDVQLLQSLQKPKKLTVIGDDGLEYSFLCKPKDDLRKDLRMMEFCAVLNRLLSRDEQSRKRRLYLRTFSVIPLSEDCGIIEWVPNTTGLRHVMQNLYVREGIFGRHTHNDIKEIYERWKGRSPLGYGKEVLQKFPPVFHKWFLDTWKDPSKWFAARKAFAHTSAVWSMVGHIVGLGDRHAENVLLDATTGDCVHVDFSCLFDKGLELETPEVVPFRLTQNMIDGLGVGGYEGAFERVCEITLDVLRNHREALMSVLETFVHDPLVEWTRGKSSSNQSNTNVVSQRKAKEALENIGARLEGVVVGVGAAPSLPLSTSGQVRRLIEEATSLVNLASMYIWWMCFF